MILGANHNHMQFEMAMTDQKVDECLNKMFSSSSSEYLPMRGKQNYMKVVLQKENAVAYCYVDCCKSSDKKYIQYQLITIVQNVKGSTATYKNLLAFQYAGKTPCSDVSEISISFKSNPSSDRISLVEIVITNKKEKKLSKLGVFAFDYEDIKNKKQLLLQEIFLNKPLLQARWHPLSSNFIVILTEECLMIAEYLIEGLQNRGFTRIKDLRISHKLVDFCFWPTNIQTKMLNLLAVGDEGTLYLILCKIDLDTKAIGNPLQRQIMKQMLFKQIARFPATSSKSIDAYSPSAGILLIFEKAVVTNSKGQSHVLSISALLQGMEDYFEKLLVSIQGDFKDGEFQLPQNSVFNGLFYFWQGNRLARVNLSSQISYLKSLLDDSIKSKLPSNNLVTEIILQVSLNTLKFMGIDQKSIKILRRAQNNQRYLFKTIQIQMCDLQLQEANTSKQLNHYFKRLQKEVQSLKSQNIDSSLCQIKTKIKLLSESGDQKDAHQVSRQFAQYINQISQLLSTQKGQLKKLTDLANSKKRQFESSKAQWSQLDQLLNRIQRNAIKIEQLQSNSKSQHSSGAIIDCIKSRCEYSTKKPLQIDGHLREQYLRSFQEQQSMLQQITKTLEQNQKLLNQIKDA